MTETPQFAAPIAAPGAEQMFTAPDPGRTGPKVPPGVKRVIGKMGGNKATTATGRPSRNAPRPLTPADRLTIVDAYEFIGSAMLLYKPAVGETILEVTQVRDRETQELVPGPTRAEICADAWMNLAEENDAVRRMILFFIESGAWGKVFAANAPILLAALPDDVLSRAMARIVPAPKPRDEDEDTVPYGANAATWGKTA